VSTNSEVCGRIFQQCCKQCDTSRPKGDRLLPWRYSGRLLVTPKDLYSSNTTYLEVKKNEAHVCAGFTDPAGKEGIPATVVFDVRTLKGINNGMYTAYGSQHNVIVA
jgi:hypothetical protein